MEIYRSFSGILAELRASFMKEVHIYARYPAWIISELVSTPLWFAIFGIALVPFTPMEASRGGGLTLQYYYWGFLFIVLFISAIWGVGQTILEEQQSGTIEQILVAPINRFTLIIGRWSRTLFTDILMLGYTSGLLVLLTNLSLQPSNPLGVALALGLYELSILGFGLIFASVTFRLKAFTTLSTLTQFLLIILGGVFFPVSALPEPVRYISLSIPFTYHMDMIRYFAIGYPSIFDPGLETLSLVALTCLLLVLGTVSFKWVERSVKIKGKVGAH